MGTFIEKPNYGIKKYEALTKKPFKSILRLEGILTFYKFFPSGPLKSSETFYDTQTDLLSKAGVILSRIQEENDVYFKVEHSAYNKAVFKKTSSKIFVHKVGVNDTLKDHAFYLVDGIRALFSTSINIDLENIVKNSIPKLAVYTNAEVFKVVSGTGFRAYLAFENIKYKNFETKRIYKAQGVTVKHNGPDQYLAEFDSFNDSIGKYCKDFLAVNDNTYEHAKNVTKAVAPKPKKDEKNKKVAKK